MIRVRIAFLEVREKNASELFVRGLNRVVILVYLSS